MAESYSNVADDDGVAGLIELAKREDLRGRDLTTALLGDPDAPAVFRLLAKGPGVFAGKEIAPAVLRAYDASIEIDWTDLGHDGARIEAVPAVLATLRGPVGAILSAERVFLNFLQRLCGVATLTRAYVDAVAGTGAAIFDTRKTTPGWRTLEKYAVRCGGGCNHRKGLYDAVLIKDNHLAGNEPRPSGSGLDPPRRAETVFDMLNRLEVVTALRRSDAKPAFVEVEADTLEQVEELLKTSRARQEAVRPARPRAGTGVKPASPPAGAPQSGRVHLDAILLDNFALHDLRRAVALRDGHGLRGKVTLEASGGITLDNVRAVAETDVDRISVGAITHSAPALDLSMERV